jgi:hypothetical protein
MKRAASVTCTNCQTIFANVAASSEEEIHEALELKPCADPDCPSILCRCCEQFQCDYCCETFCQSHRVMVPDGTPRPLACCRACAEEIARENELPAPLPMGRELRPALVAAAGMEVA